MRSAEIKRKTNETNIEAGIDIDGNGETRINTGVGFFDHMLELFARHAGVSLRIICEGDLAVDGHHSVEDIGIVLGQVMDKALGDRRGIERYASARIPMDEALVSCDMDISGRPYLCFNAKFSSPSIGGYETQLTEEFFRAVSYNSKITLHINCEYGKNDHHITEGIFKAFARAFCRAVRINPEKSNEIPSTKGVL